MYTRYEDTSILGMKQALVSKILTWNGYEKLYELEMVEVDDITKNDPNPKEVVVEVEMMTLVKLWSWWLR